MRQPVALLITALLLGACSVGSSSGGSSGDDGDDSRPPSFFETAEYHASYGLAAINASSAYATGVSGRGVTVGVIDTGIDRDHPEFAGAIAPASIDIVSGSPDNLDDQDGHGTAVAGILAARRNGELSHGVAYNAQILAVRADTDGSCASGCTFDLADIAAGTDYAVANGARVINYSLGGASALGTVLGAALRRATDAGAVLVLAAGNDGAEDPTFPARFASTPEAGGAALAVGAVDAANQLLGFSNQAGGSAEHFLVAPGDRLVAPVPGGGGALVTGTSFAAPHVTGAAALILEASPFLSAREVVDLLLDTATDLGDPGTDPVYGRGLVNLAAALRPQGTLSVPLGETVDADLAPLDGSGLQLGPAFGRGPALGRAIFLDGYGRPYWLELDQQVGSTTTAPDLLDWLAPDQAGPSFAAEVGSAVRLQLQLAAPDETALREAPPGGLHLGATPLRAPWLAPDRDADHRFALRMELGSATGLSVSHGFGLQDHFGLTGQSTTTVGGMLTGAGLGSPFLAMADRGDGIAVAQQLGGDLSVRLGLASQQGDDEDAFERGATTLMVSEVVHQWDGGSRLGVQLGRVEETASLLQSGGSGAFAQPDGAITRFFGLNGRLALSGRIAVFGQTSLGATDPGSTDLGLLRDVSTLRSLSFGTGLTAREVLRADDRLTFAVSQPLRVTGGSATIDRPVGRSFDGQILRQSDHVRLAPEGRELDLEIGYQLRLDSGRTISANWLTQLQPDHDPDAPPSHALALKLRTRF